jgi:hypothetical protein
VIQAIAAASAPNHASGATSRWRDVSGTPGTVPDISFSQESAQIDGDFNALFE